MHGNILSSEIRQQNRTEQNRTEQNRTEQNRTEQNRTELLSKTRKAGRITEDIIMAL